MSLLFNTDFKTIGGRSIIPIESLSLSTMPILGARYLGYFLELLRLIRLTDLV